jgi:hypothetical protein
MNIAGTANIAASTPTVAHNRRIGPGGMRQIMASVATPQTIQAIVETLLADAA